MANNKKFTTKNVLTAKGTMSGFINLTTPSTKFNPEGIYSANLLLSKEDGEKLLAEIKAVQKEQFKNYGQGTRLADITKCVPYTTVDPETGEVLNDPEERYVVKAQRKARIKDGRPQLTVQIIGADTKPCPNVKAGEGTEAKFGLILKGYSVAGKTGVSVDLAVVQILKLVEYGGQSLSAFGITAEEGYVADDTETFTAEPVAPEADVEEDF